MVPHLAFRGPHGPYMASYMALEALSGPYSPLSTLIGPSRSVSRPCIHVTGSTPAPTSTPYSTLPHAPHVDLT